MPGVSGLQGVNANYQPRFYFRANALNKIYISAALTAVAAVGGSFLSYSGIVNPGLSFTVTVAGLIFTGWLIIENVQLR